MDPRLSLREILKGHPELRWTEADGFVRIDAPHPGGFAVALGPQGDEWVVCAGEAGLHLTFDTGEEALDFVAWCFSGECRLREVRRGRRIEKCVFEVSDGGYWQAVSTTGFFIFPFWLPRREAFFQNPCLFKA